MRGGAPAPFLTDLERARDAYVRHVGLERGLSANTVAAYRRDLAGYLGWLAEREITRAPQVTTEVIAEFIAERGRPLAPASQARLLSSVRGFHRFLEEEGQAPADAARELRPPAQADRLPQALRIDQVSALLEATGGEDAQSVRDRALLELLYATGARVSEAISLNVDDVADLELIRLLGKGGKERIVPVGSYARAAIEAYLVRVRPQFSQRGTATPALFLGARGARVSRQNAWLIIKRAAQRAGITEEVSPHTLRHSFATHLMQGGADVRVVQELLGHSSVATTQIYTRVTIEGLRDVYTQAHPRAR